MIIQGTTIFLIGIIIGSFLNVCIYRIPRNESIAFPSSHCTACGKALKKKDLVPILSYLWLRGRCRSCGEKFSLQYPIVELLNGILYVLLYREYGLSFLFIAYALLTSALLVISFIDFYHQIIPDELIVVGIVAAVFFHVVFSYPISFLNGTIGFLVGGGIFLTIALVTKGAMGGGDIKLMAMLGLWLGWKNILLVTVLSFFIGAFVSIVLMVLKLKGRKDMIPFGPFIAIAAMLVLLYKEEILNWYISVLL